MAVDRRLSAIVFTDIVGSTELAQKDERAALALIAEQESLAQSTVAEHHGRRVKSTGDGLLMEFPSAIDAVESAVELQRRIFERNRRAEATPLRVRIGVHLGDVHGREGDIFGDSVNIAARVESAGDAGGVCISETVYNLVRNKLPYGLERLPAVRLKGLAEPMDLYRVMLPWVRASGPPADSPVPRLAVLPLANISPDASDAYFADGLTEELIAVLSKIPGLRVIARTSVIPYKSSSKSVAEIGTELGVRSILEGSVRKAGDRLRITLQLIDVTSQEHVWSERFDRELSDVFAIQTEVAERTAKAIRIELSERAREHLRRPPTSDLTAYELYLRSIPLNDEVSDEAFRQSVRLLEEAIQRDPDFALAIAHLADRFVQGAGDFLTHREGFARARTLLARALALDPDLSEAHAAQADLAMQEEHDWERARAEFQRALALNPSNAAARMSYAGLLRALGENEAAERELRASIEIHPTWWVPRWGLVDLALDRGDIPLAQERAEKLLSPDPNPPLTHLSFAMRYAKTGKEAEARRELERAGMPSTVLFRIAHAMVLGALHEPAEARTLLAELTDEAHPVFVASEYLAGLYVIVGDRERALAILETAVRNRESGLWLRHSLPAFDPIRNDPRFVAALRSFHLPDAVTQAATSAPPQREP